MAVARTRDDVSSPQTVMKQSSSRGKEPRKSRSTSTAKLGHAKELLLGLTGSPVAAAAAGGSAAVQSSQPGTAGIQRIQLPATEVDVAATAGMAGMPPMSPKHRQPKPSAQPTDYANLRAVPPHDMYPPIQVMVTPQSVPPVGDAHVTTASAQLQPPPRNYPPSPRRNFATGRGVTPPSPRRPATAAASTPTTPRRRLGATAEAILGAMAQGHMTRTLMRTDKAKGLVQTIKDTRRLISEFDSDKTLVLTANDKEFLWRARAQLQKAKEQLAAILINSTPEERVTMLQRQRGAEEEKMFRSSASGYGAPRPKTIDGPRVSKATESYLKRKREEASRPQTAPVAPRVIEPVAPLVPPTPSPATPRHTDFLRRKMGHYASDNHGVAPTAGPVVVKPGSKSTSSLGKAGKATAVPAPAHALAVADSPKSRRRERNRTTIVGDQAAAGTRIPAPVGDKLVAIESGTKLAAIERERTF